MKRNMDPRPITVKYAAKCAETGRELKPGDEAIYYPKGKALYHPESETAAAGRPTRTPDTITEPCETTSALAPR